jgi:hypothetical protein
MLAGALGRWHRVKKLAWLLSLVTWTFLSATLVHANWRSTASVTYPMLAALSLFLMIVRWTR